MPDPVRKIRLKDIAEKLGVSTATVSLCLSGGHPRYQISPETIRKVRAYAEKVGYIPDRNARNLQSGGRRSIGLLTNGHWRAGQKCLPAVFTAAQTLTARGIEVRQVSAVNQFDGLTQLRELGCGEVIVFDPVMETQDTEHSELGAGDFAKRFPGMLIHAVDYSMPLPAEECRSAHMSRLGVEVWDFHAKLVELVREHYDGEVMMHSWRCSRPLAAQLRQTAPELLFAMPGENPFLIGEAGAHQYLEVRRKRRISTVFWGDDRMACGFIKELLRCGVRIPDKLNVISFDNLEFSGYLAIPLTTWGVPIVRHTRMVLDAILQQKEPLTVVSRPVFARGESARFTPEMLQKLRQWSDPAENMDKNEG